MNDFVEVRQIVRIVRRRWWILLLATLLAVVIGYTVTTQQTKIFRAETSLFVGAAITDSTPDRSNLEISQQLSEVYADIALRRPVLQAVVDQLKLEQTWRELRSQMQVEPVTDKQLLEISIDATSPELAVAIADEVARQLIERSPAALDNQPESTADQFAHRRLELVQMNIETGQARLTTLESSLTGLIGAPPDQLRQRQEEIQTLEALIATWESTYATLYASLRGQQPTNVLTVFEPAQARANPIRPLVKLNLLVSTVIGFVLGLGLIVVLELLDKSLHSAAEAAEILRLPSLGVIRRPHSRRADGKLSAANDTFSSMTEDCRLLRSKLLLLSKTWPRKVFLVTCPAQTEGKSLVVANLAIALANIGLKTVIVDANLRNPVQHVLFNLPQENGLSEEIHSSQKQLARRLKVCQIANLYVLTSGSLRLASPDRLATARMNEVFTMLMGMADIVLCDAPEAGAVADTLVLADKVDGVLLVVDAGTTRREDARQVVSSLQQAGANMLGFVLDGVPVEARNPGLSYMGVRVPVNAIVEGQAPAES